MRRLVLLAFASVVLAMLIPTAELASTTPGVLPPQSHPHGLSYGEWQARWYEWAYVSLTVDGRAR
jgi:hypothetical protein